MAADEGDSDNSQTTEDAWKSVFTCTEPRHVKATQR